MTIDGTFFQGTSSRPIAARAELSGQKILTIRDETGAVLAEIALKKIRVSARLARLRRRLELPDGSRFETDDNDGVDAMLRGRLRGDGLLHRLESSLKWAAVSLLIACMAIWLAVQYGFPAAADWLAFRTPHVVLAAISSQTLETMDRIALDPSTLTPGERKRARALFARVAKVANEPASRYALLFRGGGAVGPNAFSLPDGRVIITDELYKLSRSDDELEGVFGHEIAHADRRHALKLLYEDSLVPAAIALMTGDASQFGQVAAALPAILIQTSFSRSLEQQADDDSARMMSRIGADPAALGQLLERLDRKLCGAKGCSHGWLGSHPDTAVRAARLRAESRNPLLPHR